MEGSFNLKTNSFMEQMTMNSLKYLEKQNGLCQLKIDGKLPAEKQAVLMWEQKNTLLLPDDLKNFYLSSNGFYVTWSVKMENTTIPVGKMHINSVLSLVRLVNASGEGTHVQPSLWDLDMEENDESGGETVPSFVSNKIFELDPCDGYGKVCLVFHEVKPGDSSSDSSTDGDESDFSDDFDYVPKIWFLDRSCHWHHLCDSFTEYFRLMLMHIGLPFWQMSFTDIGLPPQSKQWFNMFAPVRLEVDVEGAVDSTFDSHTDKIPSSPLDLSKIFKGKTDRKKTAVTQGSASNPSSSQSHSNTRKKFPVTSARSSSSLVKMSGGMNSQVPMRSNRP